jgi:ketosteroid isomerase-like protein
MDEDLVELTKAMDRCWIERRFDDLRAYIDNDVVMVAPGGRQRMNGLAAAIDSYRAFMERSSVERYETRDHQVAVGGDAAVVEYGWTMVWESGGTRHDGKGREVLVLSRRHGDWKVIWRTQLPD